MDFPLPLSHPFFLELIASIGEAARERGCDFSVSHTVPANFDDVFATVRKTRVKGAIFLGQGSLHQAFNRLASFDAASSYGARKFPVRPIAPSDPTTFRADAGRLCI